MNVKDPYLREIFKAGYTHVVQSRVEDTITLCRQSDGYEKKITRTELIRQHFTVKGGLNRALGEYYWLADSDGSAKRFRQLIKPEK